MKLLALALQPALNTIAIGATFGMKESGASLFKVDAKHSCQECTFDKSYRYAFIRIVRYSRLRDQSALPLKL
jgi:hypothetical protein